MPTLEELQQDVAARAAFATHMLLVGDTKLGKSRYVAEAAKAGYTVIYIDADNGLSTLMDESTNLNDEAKARIHYFNPVDLTGFVESLLTDGIFRYNLKTRDKFSSANSTPDTRLVEIIPSRIPPNTIVSLDSWTSLSWHAMRAKAASLNISLTDIDKYSRELYGPSGHWLTQIALLIQKSPFNWIVQAHRGSYERKEKPPGRVEDVKEKDMIIKETLEIPQSSSGPHGATLGKYFNQIGYLTMDRANRRLLDFRVIQGRVGGGTPGGIGDPLTEYSFYKLFGRGMSKAELSPPINPEAPWINTLTMEEFNIKMGRVKTGASTQTNVTKPVTPKPTPAAAATPATASPPMMKIPAGLTPQRK